MKKKLYLIFLLAGMVFNASGQQTVEKFVQETRYLLYLPKTYAEDTLKWWPLVIFLHGSGESGTDIAKVKAHGPPELVEKGRDFPFILVSPQADRPGGWETGLLYNMLQDIKRKYRVNRRKIYLTGLSMGGYGTWALAMKYPDEFAAIAPVCGGGDTADAWKMRNIPIWCFHGAKDDVVPPAASENLVRAVRPYNSSVRFTLYPEANHNSWDLTYNKDSLYTWLLAQEKFQYRATPSDTNRLKKFAGRYLGPDRDTIAIVYKDGKLEARPPGENLKLYHAGNDLFYIFPDQSLDIRFFLRGNKTTGFLFLGDRKIWFPRLD